MTEGKLSDKELKYYTGLMVFCPFCKAICTAEAKAHLDFDLDYMKDHPNQGPIYSLWVSVTCKSCKAAIYAREDHKSMVWRDPFGVTPLEKGN